MTIDLRIKKFDISKINNDVISIIGKRGVGKSLLIKNILNYYNDVKIGAIISASEASVDTYSDIVSKDKIYKHYDTQIIGDIIKEQRENKDTKQIIVMDDELQVLKVDDNLKELFMNGRCLNIIFIFTLQYPMTLQPDIRYNIDYTFIFKENVESNRKRLYEWYAGVIPTYEIFNSILDQCTQNYECLVIDNKSNNNWKESLYWYKVEPKKEETKQKSMLNRWYNWLY